MKADIEVPMTAAPAAGARPASAGIQRTHARILRQTSRMVELVQGRPGVELEARADAVSGWSVVEQLEHLMLVDRGALRALGRLLDDPQVPRAPGVNLLGRLVLGTGFMPRGRGKAPPAVHPGGGPSAEAVRAGLPEIDRQLRALAPRLGKLERSRGRLRHPFLGGLDGRQWLRFVALHHHHHLKIVRDILRARGLAAIGGPRRSR